MHRTVRFAALLGMWSLLASCAVGAPLGFSSGDVWSFPLVAPLEDGEFLVPVKVNDKGPYLFMIDTDSPVSHVDEVIRSDLDLHTVRGPEEPDERDVMVPTALAEVAKFQIGDKLTVSSLTKVRVHKFGAFSSQGRQVRGILGRDVIADSLIFAVDRDRGIGYLATQGHFDPPPGAEVIKFRQYRFQAGSPRRRITEGTLHGGHKVAMHIDLGAHTSQIWARKADELKLPKIGVRARMTDELATTRNINFGYMAADVQMGNVKVNGILLLPYEDKRTREVDLDGSLGMNFFKDYNVVANWHKKSIYLTRRAADPGPLASERMGRWGDAFEKCANPACVTVKMEPAKIAWQPAGPGEGEPGPDEGAPEEPPDDGGGAVAPPPPPPQSYTFSVTRDSGAPAQAYDVLIEALGADGKPMAVPRLLVTLEKGAAGTSLGNFDPAYAAAKSFRVLDLGPFPRECVAGRCVFPITPKR